MNRVFKGCMASSIAMMALSAQANAQEAAEGPEVISEGGDEATAAQSNNSNSIVVTATKRGGETVQSAALPISVLDTQTMRLAQVRNLFETSNLLPNVFLNQNGSFPGTATFSIRGMTITSSVPSSTPSVGVFVDGIYAGVNAGLGSDSFDYGSMEVLRGPQGLLFGRNVTAGAILIQTTDPTDYWTGSAELTIESGPEFIESVSISGPLSESVQIKLAAYRSDDDGYFTNSFDGSEFGERDNTRIHAAVRFRLAENIESTFRAIFADTRGDGSPIGNFNLFDRDSFDFTNDTPGTIKGDMFQVSNQTDIDVDFGNGTITNIIGYRHVEQDVSIDFDGTADPVFIVNDSLMHRQFSNELRYSGDFDRAALTVGAYFYADHLNYFSHRDIRFGPLQQQAGGGILESQTYAAFSSLDYEIVDDFFLNLGARYSHERKQAQVATISPVGGTNTCTVTSCSAFGFNDSETWSAFTPKIGASWQPNRDTNIYAFWTRGNRSGGYSVRHTSTGDPGPYDQETVDSYEFGIKKQWFQGDLVTNFAAFVSEYSDLQRDVVIVCPGSVRCGTAQSPAQLTTNAADARIKGFEFEVNASPADFLDISANVGYIHGEYTDVFFNLSGNSPTGDVTPEDFLLDLPGLSPWSYGIGATWTNPIGDAELITNIRYNHRDESKVIELNTTVYDPVDNINASISYRTNDFTLTAFVRNLLNDVTYGTNLPFGPSLGHVPLNEGRILGASARVHW